jgi:hypothetical protein
MLTSSASVQKFATCYNIACWFLYLHFDFVHHSFNKRSYLELVHDIIIINMYIRINFMFMGFNDFVDTTKCM